MAAGAPARRLPTPGPAPVLSAVRRCSGPHRDRWRLLRQRRRRSDDLESEPPVDVRQAVPVRLARRGDDQLVLGLYPFGVRGGRNEGDPADRRGRRVAEGVLGAARDQHEGTGRRGLPAPVRVHGQLPVGDQECLLRTAVDMQRHGVEPRRRRVAAQRVGAVGVLPADDENGRLAVAANDRHAAGGRHQHDPGVVFGHVVHTGHGDGIRRRSQNTVRSTSCPASTAPAVVRVSGRTRKCWLMVWTSRSRRCSGWSAYRAWLPPAR